MDLTLGESKQIYKYNYQYYYLRGFPYLDSLFFSSKKPLHPYIYVETKLKDNPVKMQL